MQITFLGSGGAFCDHRVNYHNNALIETAEGPVLLDCGTTALQSMREIGVAPQSIRAVLFTHLHADHASPQGLIGYRFYVPDDGGSLAHLPTPLVGPTDVIAPLLSSLHPFLDEYQDRKGVLRHGGVLALTQPTETNKISIGGVHFRFFRVPHVRSDLVDKPAYGLEIDDGIHRIVWSGDTTFDDRFVRGTLASGKVDALFHECTFGPRIPTPVHTHWSDLQTLPEDHLERIVLMHHTQVPDGAVITPARAAARHSVFRWDR